ncbi:hypothetical protein PIB30_030767 [Stylosanthes scabra]|uniref:Zinc finger GRF-type domain-containing protein n=1 Tax=Stylosanthes scabra TaxID=79078 RepID=A0ABU6YC13_9FABA|nr:hypothetical protein [Stylosanthes scabra]
MEIDGLFSGSRRSGSGRRGERSSSSTQGFFAAKVENERGGAAPKCNCGVYAISHNHCNFFLWLDRHLAKFGKTEQFKGGEDEEDVNENFAKMKLEIRLGDLEERVYAIEKKKKRMHVFVIVLGIAVVLLSICVSRV